jgi:hypothetical protein
MNELESFLINLNLIQTNNNENESNLSSSNKEINEKIADYTLNGNNGGSWKILKSIYENKLDINEIFGEKLINLLIDTCAQLVCNLSTESKYHLDKHSFQSSRNSSKLYLNLFDDSFDREDANLNESQSNVNKDNNSNDDETFKYSIKLSNSNGTLFDLIIICLNLFIKYNDGRNNTILTDRNNNKELVLNTFCDCIFNKVNNQDANSNNNINLIRLIYLKFLNKLFKLNFKNLNNQTSSTKSTVGPTMSNLATQSSIVFKQTSNHLFIEQFKLITQNNSITNIDQLTYIVKMIINYLFNFAKSFKFITDSSLFKSNYYNSTNMYSFECLSQLLNETLQFLFDNILKLDQELIVLRDDQNFFDFKKYKMNNIYWKRLTMILIEMKSFKNSYQHAQICLRSKHTHISCKINLYEIENRHDDISLIQKSCLFAKLADILFKNLVSNFTSTDNLDSDCILKLILKIKSNRIIQIINKLGICTCINLDELINMQTIRSKKYFFNQNICSIIFDYLLSVFNYSSKSSNLNSPVEKQQSSSSSSSKITKRRSIFFPLMVDESLTDSAKLLNKDLANFATNIIVETSDKDRDLFKQFYDIIIRLDEKSILIVKYLISSLNKYTKYLPHLLTHNDQSNNNKQDDLEVNLSTKYRWFIHEIFYLFKNVLDYLNNENDENEKSFPLFEMICKYLGEFLILSNSNANYNTKNCLDMNKSSNKSSATSTPYQTEKRNSSVGVGLSSSSTFNSRSGLGDNYYTLQDSVSNQQIELKINTQFLEFMNDNSIKLYDLASNFCLKHNQTPHLAISLCSQLIFFKNSQQEQFNFKTTGFNLNIEQHLSKCLIDTINSNLSLLNSTHVLDILVELYVKCSTFRLCLNECNLFHSNLMNCLTQTFQSLESSNCDTNVLKYLELLLDVIFVYFYYNRKVGFINIFLL